MTKPSDSKENTIFVKGFSKIFLRIAKYSLHPMLYCQKCSCFLHDYLDRPLTTQDNLYRFVHKKNMKHYKSFLVGCILRGVSVLNEEVLKRIQEDILVRNTLIGKPKTVQEHYELFFFCLEHYSPKFKQQLKDIITDIQAHEIVRINNNQTEKEQIEDFLANLFSPIVESLFQIHNEHSVKHSASYFNQLSFTSTITTEIKKSSIEII